MKYLLIVILLIILAFSCKPRFLKAEETNNKEYKIEYLFEKDGCKVYRFWDNGHYVYFTNCSGNIYYKYTTNASKQTQSKKILNMINIKDTIILLP